MLCVFPEEAASLSSKEEVRSGKDEGEAWGSGPRVQAGSLFMVVRGMETLKAESPSRWFRHRGGAGRGVGGEKRAASACQGGRA